LLLLIVIHQGKHSSDVCLPLPNVPATTDQHITIAPCTSPVTLFSMYNVMVVSQSPFQWHYGFNSKFFSLCNVCNPSHSMSQVFHKLYSLQFRSAAV